MNQIKKSNKCHQSENETVIRQLSLVGAIRTALMASGIALMGTGAVYAQSCVPTTTVTCGTEQGTALHDLTTVNDGSKPSAVTSGVLASDSAAITRAAASTVRIVNRGNITKEKAGDVVGITASLDDAIVTVVNEGAIKVTSTNGGLADGIFSAGARTHVTNNGSITALGYSWVAGIENQSSDSARINNSGDIFVDHVTNKNPGDMYGHVYGIFSRNSGDGGTVINNRADIIAGGHSYSTGIFAYDGGRGGLRLSNTGDITLTARADDSNTPEDESIPRISTGIFASTTAPGGDITLSNSGAVEASSLYRGATGIAVSAYGDKSKATVTNSGTISANGLAPAVTRKYSGNVLNVLAGGDIAILNTTDGVLKSASIGGATGVQANSTGGNIRITNAGLFDIYSLKYTAAAVLAKSDTGRADFNNTGTISAHTVGEAIGAFVEGATGATATNSGLIELAPAITSTSGATTGLISLSSLGDASVRNTTGGTIQISNSSGTSGAARGTGIHARADVGNASANNAGLIQLYTPDRGSEGTLFGARASAGAGGNATVLNSGTINIEGIDLTSLENIAGTINGVGAVALHVQTVGGAARATNLGTLVLNTSFNRALATPEIIGLFGTSDTGNVTLTNSGSIKATVTYNLLPDNSFDKGPVGLDGISGKGKVNVTNTGEIVLEGLSTTGLRGTGRGSTVTLRNDGAIIAKSSAGNATGISGTITGGSLVLRNTGDITASSINGTAHGILGTVGGGQVQVLNNGNLIASSVNGDAYGILVRGNTAANIDNTGSIVAAIAIQGSDGNNTINNRGSLFGSVITGAGNDTITNASTALWNLIGSNADFGAGNDSLRNQGTLLLGGSQIAFGAGNNSFNNTGTVKLSGNNTVQLGGGSTAVFTNNGLLDFVNGKVGDNLTIAGNFAGKGNINMDVNLRAGRGDLLYISGQTAAGTVQKLNVALLDGLPTSQSVSKPLQLVQVAGNADPKAFVAGQVLGVSPADFLKLSMNVAVAKEPTGNGGSYLLSITPKVTGLNAVGTLASAAALGVDSLLASTTGNWRDRASMVQASSALLGLNGLKGITPWVRGFSDTGGMNPNYVAGNFGQVHSSNLYQDNRGSEAGFNLDAGNGLSLGASVAKSEAKQYLASGTGMDTLRGASVGLYATWHSANGTYVDASVRGMQFDAHMDTVAGRQESKGNAHMFNLETGRTWTLRNGLNLEPQLQYTATTVAGMSVQGHQAEFETDTAQWQRGRMGLQLWKSYRNASGWNVTPYGQVSAIHTFDGTLGYNINRDFYGQLNSEGTNAMIKLGLTTSKGRFAFGSALNWQSGETVDSGLGAQARVSYAW